MNRTQAYKIRRLGKNTFDQVEFLGTDGGGYAVSCDGTIYYNLETFYARHPRFHLPYATRKRGKKWVVVFIEDEDERREREVDDGALHERRYNAICRAGALNEAYQKEREEIRDVSFL